MYLVCPLSDQCGLSSRLLYWRPTIVSIVQISCVPPLAKLIVRLLALAVGRPRMLMMQSQFSTAALHRRPGPFERGRALMRCRGRPSGRRLLGAAGRPALPPAFGPSPSVTSARHAIGAGAARRAVLRAAHARSSSTAVAAATRAAPSAIKVICQPAIPPPVTTWAVVAGSARAAGRRIVRPGRARASWRRRPGPRRPTSAGRR